MAAPKVQTISEAMMELNPAYAQSNAVIQKRQAGLGAKYDAQRAGLTAEKGQGFNAINNQATGRGMSFSGIPLDEQATYLSTKYLPGLQQANYQQNDEDLTLQGQIAANDKELRLGAVGRVDRQTSDLNSWNQNERQIQAQAEAARLQREAQAREAQLNRQNEASIAAANRAASAAAAAPTGPTTSQIVRELTGWANGRVGGDKKLSPSDFRAGYSKAFEMGVSKDDYVAVMQRYINNRHAKDYRF